MSFFVRSLQALITSKALRIWVLPVAITILFLVSTYVFVWVNTQQRQSPQTLQDSKGAKLVLEEIAHKDPKPDEAPKTSRAEFERNQKMLSSKNSIDSPNKSPSSSIDQFASWLQTYQKLDCLEGSNCTIHDPRKVMQFLKVGQKLAKKRKPVFQRLITQDPEKALELAIPEELSVKLPPSISAHLENWVSGYGNVRTHYDCKAKDHGSCDLERSIETQDGQLKNAHTYGSRNAILNLEGIHYWGVSIGDDMAIAEHPYRVVQEQGNQKDIYFAGEKLAFENPAQQNLFAEQMAQAERRAQILRKTVRYPVQAGSEGSIIYLEKRYAVIPTPMSWADAHAEATAQNGRLVCIGSSLENEYVRSLLNDINASFGWIGLTDDPNQPGTTFNKDTNITSAVTLQASNGDWKWLSGDDVSSGFSNWTQGVEPNSTTFEYAALDTNDSTWQEVNQNLVLPFVIEFDNGLEPNTNVVPIDGYRKVLVIPARFKDEGTDYPGTSSPVTDAQGNPGIQQDGFEPISQEALAAAMEDVKQFYLRNSDGALYLDPVITATVTMDLDKYSPTQSGSPGSLSKQYDSSPDGPAIINATEIVYPTFPFRSLLEQIGANAVDKAAMANKLWDFHGPAFRGVASIEIIDPSGVIDGNFSEPPEVILVGGGIDPNTNRLDPDFVPAKVEPIVNSRGELTRLKVLDAGAFYHPIDGGNPLLVQINGDTSFSNDFNVTVDNICVSWVVVTTYTGDGPTAWGLGWLGAPGSHAMSPNPNGWDPENLPGNPMFAVTVAHELGHNFGLKHANIYESWSERPNSDEGQTIGYANPYSIMGNKAPINSGDLTIPAKVMVKKNQDQLGFGLRIGDRLGYDVGTILNAVDLQATDLSENNDSSLPSNTFRIFRHDYARGPFPLRTGEFYLRFPEDSGVPAWLNAQAYSPNLKIGGPGEKAEAFLDMTASQPKLTITRGGRGYSEDPTLEIVDGQGEVLLQIDPSWIQEKNGLGANSFTQANLRDFSEGALRGLRGLEINASMYSPQSPVALPFSAYWLSYRRSASEYGLTVLTGLGSDDFTTDTFDGNQYSAVEHALLDMTPNTPGDYTDCFLILGHTFSDYEADVHITPIAKGGTSPMDYLDVVVNMGTGGTTQIPNFKVTASTRTPRTGEEVSIEVEFEDQDTNGSAYAYGWFTNENMELDSENFEEVKYEWINRKMTYHEAASYARSKGGYLASISSQAEFNQVYSLVTRNIDVKAIPEYYGVGSTTGATYFWIGGSDALNEGIWQWESGEPFLYSKWGPVEPDNFDDGSGMDQDAIGVALNAWPLGERGQWNDIKVTERFTFVIEYPESKRNIPNARKNLNQRRIVKSFDLAGHQVVRVVVSDMKGAVASSNLIFEVGDYELEEKSMVSGTVRSDHGYIQGARVAFAPAQVIEHKVTMEGNERDWFIPDGSNYPLSFAIDGVRTPELELVRGQIHRFYFDESAARFGMSFFDEPETEAPRVEIKMKVTPSIDAQGGGYIINPEVNTTDISYFSSYFSHEVGTIRDYQDIAAAGLNLGEQNQTFLISRPSAKSLLSDTNVTSLKVGPTETDPFGNFLIFGGTGHSRNNPPLAYILRDSLWEDYSDPNATVEVFVDGVGTISPVTSNNGFLSQRWGRVAAGDPTPDLVVWGTGSEANASVSKVTTGNNNHHHLITVHNQGLGYDPNGTMAVLHWPTAPLAMWTFDRHESLYDDSNNTRLQPSPAWNNFIESNEILHYWNFDEDSGTILTDQNPRNNATPLNIDLTADINGSQPKDFSDPLRSDWGVMGRALRLHSNEALDFSGALPANYPFTFSMWMLPEVNTPTEIRFTGDNLTSTHVSGNPRQFLFNAQIQDRSTVFQNWVHVAVVAHEDSNYTFYIDGSGFEVTDPINILNIPAVSVDGLLDETYIYQIALTEVQIKYLAGRHFLDLSGNKMHLAAIGGDFPMTSPDSDPGSSADIPTPNNPGNRVGSLGNSFTGEGNGRSIQLDGNDYLDLSPHLATLGGMDSGSLSFWIKSSTGDNIILSASDRDDNDTFLKISLNDSNGFLEFLLMVDGKEVSNFYGSSPLTDNSWHHVVLGMDDSETRIYVDGQSINPRGYAGGSGVVKAFFVDVKNLNTMAIGRHLDSNVTEWFSGQLDDFYIYDRVLNASEVSFLYNLNRGREQVPRLEAIVDAVGTTIITDHGLGYKELPEVLFSYGQDGNLTAQLIAADKNVTTEADLNTTVDPTRHGQLIYVTDEDQVYSYHYSTEITNWRTGAENGWRPYHLAIGETELNATRVANVLWTKTMPTFTEFTLPDGRDVNKTDLEYVAHDPVSGSFIPASGLFGYYVPPNIHIGGSPTENNATAYALLYLDENTDETAVITNPGFGHGPVGLGAFNDIVKISGKGFRPAQSLTIRNEDFLNDPSTISISINGHEDHDPHATVFDLGDTNITALNPGDANDPFSSVYAFQDFISFSAEAPEINDVDFNQTLSHITVEDDGFGYLVPLEVFPLGGSPSMQNTQAWVEAGNLVPNFLHAQLRFAPNITDANGSILEGNNSVTVVDGGYGYHVSPQIIVTGGGGNGAEANATLGEKFLLSIGSDVVSIGLLNPSLLRNPPDDDPDPIMEMQVDRVPRSVSNSLIHFELNATVGAVLGVEAFDTVGFQDGNLTINFPAGTTVNDLITELNRPENAAIYDPQILGNATLVQGLGTSLLDELNGSSFMSLHSISQVTITAGGRGYFNTLEGNLPTASLTYDSPLSADERNASLDLKLGGALSSIGACTSCQFGGHDHMSPWVEIWDKGRNESEISDRALAVPKIKNGKVEKVIVVDPGTGYIDPVARIHGFPAKHEFHRNLSVGGAFYDMRWWRCRNLRENRSGVLVECGHVQIGEYPPESCPGEEDFAGNLNAWQNGHGNARLRGQQLHYCAFEPLANTHFNVAFKTTICGGTKINFVLIDDPTNAANGLPPDYYRSPYEDWVKWDANLSVITEQGRIQEITVDYGGEMYLGGELAVSGSGAGVDAIPIIDENGSNIGIILDDEYLKNAETDLIDRPSGGGMGFIERPWSWDSISSPNYGVPEILIVHTGSFDNDHFLPGIYGEEAQGGPGFAWGYGDPIPELAGFGNRIEAIEVDDPGIFASSRNNFQVVIDYDGTGISNFQPAQATPHTAFSLIRLRFDGNATYLDQTPQNNANLWRTRSLYQDTPNLYLHDPNNNFDFSEQNSSDFIRANGTGNYLDSTRGSYFDFYVDDRFPNDFYYGFGRALPFFPSMGAKVSVYDPIPGATWAINDPEDPEPLERNMSVYTDQNGYYAMPNLEPGLYNVAVFLEDKNFQESTFRPEANFKRVSEIVYVPGMPTLYLNTDNGGIGASNLSWSVESRRMSRPQQLMSAHDEDLHERYILEGIGAGFRLGERPELFIMPSASNSSGYLPTLEAIGLVDGSLRIELINDANNSRFNPEDQFSVHFSSTVSGIDFIEDYPFSFSPNNSWAGSAKSPTAGEPRLLIFPGDGNGTNFVEIPIGGTERNPGADNNRTFTAQIYDQNGIDTTAVMANVQWSLTFDFNDSMETNSSNIASLSQSSGATTEVSLFSTLRRGRVLGFEILNAGLGYSHGSEVYLNGSGSGFLGRLETNASGSVTGVQILEAGENYSSYQSIEISDDNGTGASLRPLMGGYMYLEANYTLAGGQVLESRVRLSSSERNRLSILETWLDQYTDSILEKNASWWDDLTYDFDDDNLSNREEWENKGNPNAIDTDYDGLDDFFEMILETSLTKSDTDADGLTDFNETMGVLDLDGVLTTTNPLLPDTDLDGLIDSEEIALGLDPNSVTSTASIGGIILNPQELDYDLFLFLESNATEDAMPFVDIAEQNMTSLDSNQTLLYKISKSSIVYKEKNDSVYDPTNHYLYHFPRNAVGQSYRITAFFNIEQNASSDIVSYDVGEPVAQWTGTLTQDVFDANLYLKDTPPNIGFIDAADQVIELNNSFNGTYTFAHNVQAIDLVDGEWNETSQNVRIEFSGSLTDYLVDYNQSTRQLSSFYLEVNKTIPLGTYNLSYQAIDSTDEESEIIEQTIVVNDEEAPVLQLTGLNPYVLQYGIDQTWVDPGYLVSDNRDDPEAIQVVVSGTPDLTTKGSYFIEYLATDLNGNEAAVVTREVQVSDLDEPYVQLSETLVVLAFGDSFVMPEYSSSDNYDGDLTDQVLIQGLDSLDTNTPGDYEIIFTVVDSSGNLSDQEILTVRVEPPAFSLSGTAVDGYLIGATVIFDVDGDGVSDIGSVGITDEHGGFSLFMTNEEFASIDINDNAILDPTEGRLVVTGGTDSLTGEAFSATMLADANSSVVTPLSSLVVGLLDQGLGKNESLQKITEILGLVDGLDLTTYDPLEQSALGDTDASAVLVQGARIANLLKQSEALVSHLKGNEYQAGQASAALVDEIAQGLNQNTPNFILSDHNQLESVIASIVDQQVGSGAIDTEELQSFVSLIDSTDALHQQLLSSSDNPLELAGELAKQQKAIEQEVMEAYDALSYGEGSLMGLADSISTDSLNQSANSFADINLFAPKADDFSFVFRTLDFQAGDEIYDFSPVDLDGDEFQVSIHSGNHDSDGDGINLLATSEDGKLLIQDPNELVNIANSQIAVEILLEDDEGKTSVTRASLKIDNALTLSSSQGEAAGWMESDWLGSFYSTGGSWLFHSSFGWLYVHPAGNGGYWFWDSHAEFWWWTDPTFYPYLYFSKPDQEESGWGYFLINPTEVQMYDFNKQEWSRR